MNSYTTAATISAALLVPLIAGCSGAAHLAPQVMGASPYTMTQSVNGHVLQRSYSLLAPDLQERLVEQRASAPKRGVEPSRVVDQVPCNGPQSPAKVYVSEYYADDIHSYNQATLNPANTSTFSGLMQPQGLDVYGQRVYVADSGAQNIKIYTKCGGPPIASLPDPTGVPASVAHDTAGNLYVANIFNFGGTGEVRYYAGSTGSGIKIGDPLMNYVYFVTVDSQGNVFDAGIDAANIFHVDWCHNVAVNHCKSGGATWQATGIPLTYYPAGIRIDASGQLVVSQQEGNTTIYSVPGFTQVSSHACPGGSGPSANCFGLGFDGSGNKLFLPDETNGNAWKVNYPGFGGATQFGIGLSPTGEAAGAAAWPAPPWGG